jgi:hypothetical protein
MDDAAALRVAIDLFHVPSRVRALRSSPLPRGVSFLLEIAAGDEAAEAQAVALTGRDRSVIKRAAAFFIEQILLAPDADSYRVLGSSERADSADLRRNMALLLRWLHPDKDPHNDRSLFAARVTRAWNDLKTPERRAAYDASFAAVKANDLREPLRRRKGRSGSRPAGSRLASGGHHVRRVAPGPPSHRNMLRVGLFRRALLLLFGRVRTDR